jgi:hypothetical protein
MSWLREACPACQAPVVWAISITTAAWTPLNADPTPDGTLELQSSWDGHPRARKVSPKLAFGRKELRAPHATTCTRKEQLKLHHYGPPPAGTRGEPA